ncbi:hypothetical protein L2Y94_15915 [Luteibacter aegosomatis]|uniref:DUF6931 family protein n=1 Tax=Luteibacter aegosomatis TaxID=2911537 RepID=UPI001FF974B2|nr:hypothetical protein [Luteibacter aegosomatis]UPG84793.1 hypothetical protein L2Y94_15915 [Luteibacter aegosomatis]
MNTPIAPVLAARDMALADAEQAVLRDGMSPRRAVHALLDAGLVAAALRLAVRLMPRGYVVPWICQCVRSAVDDERELAGIAVAEAWMRERDEPRRRDALAHAMARDFNGVGALVAASAAWAEGRMLDGEGQPIGPVPVALMARTAAAALLLIAATAGDFDARCRAYASAALDLLPLEETA